MLSVIPCVPHALKQTVSHSIWLGIFNEGTKTLRTLEKPPGREGGNENSKSNY